MEGENNNILKRKELLYVLLYGEFTKVGSERAKYH